MSRGLRDKDLLVILVEKSIGGGSNLTSGAFLGMRSPSYCHLLFAWSSGVVACGLGHHLKRACNNPQSTRRWVGLPVEGTAGGGSRCWMIDG